MWLIFGDAGILDAILPLPPGAVHRAFCRLEGVVLTPRLFAPELDASTSAGAMLVLSENATHYATTVLRRAPGDALELFNGRGASALARLELVEKRRAGVSVTGPIRQSAPNRLSLQLIQGLAVGDKMDWIVEKAVELGVQRISPWSAERSQLKLDTARAAKRLEHWRAVAVAACMQSGQNWLPTIDPVHSLDESLDELLTTAAPVLMFGAVSGGTRLQQIDWSANTRFCLVIGPESGISEKETEKLALAQAIPVHLGPRILRTETAGLAALAAIQALAGDWRD